MMSNVSKMSMMDYYFLYIFFFTRSVRFLLLKRKEVIFILDIEDIMDRKTPPAGTGGVWCLFSFNGFQQVCDGADPDHVDHGFS